MNASTLNVIEPRLLREQEAIQYTGLGRNSFRQWAAQIGAVRRFGKSVRYDKQVIDREFDRMSKEQGGN